MGQVIGDRAVVLGAGMAGLLAARVLSESYRSVVIVDRDEVEGVEGARRGVPQGRHAHALLAKGQQILQELFPGLDNELAASNVPAGDLAGDLRWYFNGQRLAPARSGLMSISSTRPVLESHVRTRVAALPQVTFKTPFAVRGLRTGGHGRIIGVTLAGDGDQVEELDADLVVDATGRGSRSSLWLRELGYAPPAEDRITINLAYTTRRFLLNSDPYGADLSINPVASLDNPRGAFFPKLHDGSSMLSLTGMLGDHPPTDIEGFLAFTKTLAAPEIYEAVKDAEPLDDPVTFKYPASVRRRYERLTEFPRGFLVIGDGVCSFNPVYGQGMTVAALEATVLQEQLGQGTEPDAIQFFRAIAPLIDSPWDISAGGDLNFPGVEGPRTLKVRMGNAYMGKLHTAATRDARVTEAFFRVAGLVDPPQALMRPSMVLRVLRNSKPTGDAGRPLVSDQVHVESGSKNDQ